MKKPKLKTFVCDCCGKEMQRDYPTDTAKSYCSKTGKTATIRQKKP